MTQHLDSARWTGWVYPLPTLDDRRQANISDGFSADETSEHRQHLGVDVMYRRRPDEPAELPRGTKLFYMPENTPVLAAFDGKIWSTNVGDYGHSVTLDHGDAPEIGPAVTFYQHMASFNRSWKKGDVVRAGDVLGIVGGPLTGYPLEHLHFELWLPTRDNAIDPAPYMTKWERRPAFLTRMPFQRAPEPDVPPTDRGGRLLSTPLLIGIAATGLLAIGLAIASAGSDDAV